jgi:aconitate hydratase
VTIGSYASYPHLAAIAAFVRGRRFAPGVDVVVAPGSQRILATAVRDGVLADLTAAGARVLAVGADTDRRAIGPAPTDAASVSYAGAEAERSASRHWEVGLMTAAASALVGRIADPRDVEGERIGRLEPESYVLAEALPRKPAAASDEAASPDDGVRAARAFEPLTGPIRGPVLLQVGDRVGAAEMLPRTAKAEAVWSNVPALARRTFAARDPGFADRALRGGGVVVAGEAFGVGGPASRAAIALRELGVRVVLARSWAEAFRQDAIEHGLLPLTFASQEDARSLRPGDELELPTLPEGLEPNRPVVVRNLTRGGQLAARHDLDAREITIVRAGGLLGVGADRARTSRVPNLEEQAR